MAIQVLVFEGGEFVTDSCEHVMADWSVSSAIAAFTDKKGDDWPTEDCTELYNKPTTLADTVMIISDNLIQATACGVDGGMLYIVRK